MNEITTKTKQPLFTKQRLKMWAKFILKWLYKCTLGLVIRFFKYRFLLAYYCLKSLNPAAILISALEIGFYLFLAYQLAKDTVEVILSFF